MRSVTDTPGEREESLDVIQRELTAFARRARAAAARLHPELPLVSYTLLAHIDDRHGCRATDLAAHYMLDKSTVSRQIAHPGEARPGGAPPGPRGPPHPGAASHRGRDPRPRLDARPAAARPIQERLAEWTADDLARFADYLLRYNASGGTRARGRGRATSSH